MQPAWEILSLSLSDFSLQVNKQANLRGKKATLASLSPPVLPRPADSSGLSPAAEDSDEGHFVMTSPCCPLSLTTHGARRVSASKHPCFQTRLGRPGEAPRVARSWSVGSQTCRQMSASEDAPVAERDPLLSGPTTPTVTSKLWETAAETARGVVPASQGGGALQAPKIASFWPHLKIWPLGPSFLTSKFHGNLSAPSPALRAYQLSGSQRGFRLT